MDECHCCLNATEFPISRQLLLYRLSPVRKSADAILRCIPTYRETCGLVDAEDQFYEVFVFSRVYVWVRTVDDVGVRLSLHVDSTEGVLTEMFREAIGASKKTVVADGGETPRNDMPSFCGAPIQIQTWPKMRLIANFKSSGVKYGVKTEKALRKELRHKFDIVLRPFPNIEIGDHQPFTVLRQLSEDDVLIGDTKSYELRLPSEVVEARENAVPILHDQLNKVNTELDFLQSEIEKADSEYRDDDASENHLRREKQLINKAMITMEIERLQRQGRPDWVNIEDAEVYYDAACVRVGQLYETKVGLLRVSRIERLPDLISTNVSAIDKKAKPRIGTIVSHCPRAEIMSASTSSQIADSNMPSNAAAVTATNTNEKCGDALQIIKKKRDTREVTSRCTFNITFACNRCDACDPALLSANPGNDITIGEFGQCIMALRHYFSAACGNRVPSIIHDGTARIGEDTKMLRSAFPRAWITSFETNPHLFGHLEANVKSDGRIVARCMSVTVCITDYIGITESDNDKPTAVFLSPSWVPVDENKIPTLELNGWPLASIVNHLFKTDATRYVILKIPMDFKIGSFGPSVHMSSENTKAVMIRGNRPNIESYTDGATFMLMFMSKPDTTKPSNCTFDLLV